MARGPLALERLSRREDGKLEYRPKKASQRRNHHPGDDAGAAARADRCVGGEAQNPLATRCALDPYAGCAGFLSADRRLMTIWLRTSERTLSYSESVSLSRFRNLSCMLSRSLRRYSASLRATVERWIL